MKYLLVTVFGFVIGCALVLVGLYYNPFTADSGVISGVNARVLTYRSPFTEGLAVTHSGRVPVTVTTGCYPGVVGEHDP